MLLWCNADADASKHATNFRFNARLDFRFDLHTLSALCYTTCVVSYLGHVRRESFYYQFWGTPIGGATEEERKREKDKIEDEYENKNKNENKNRNKKISSYTLVSSFFLPFTLFNI